MSQANLSRRFPRFDYAYLAGLVNSNAPREVFLLSEPAQQVLSDLAEIVLWKRTRWYNGSDAEIDALAAQIYEELKVAYHFDDLFPLIDEVETLLRQLTTIANCCPNNLTYFPVTPVPDPGYNPQTGPVPPTYGDGEVVADIDDYRELVCGAANAYVDYLVSIGATMDGLVTAGLVATASVATILGILSAAGLVLAIAYDLAAAVTILIINGATGGLYETAGDDIEAIRADLVCAMMTGSGAYVAFLIEQAIDPLAWSTFYKWIDYDSAVNVLMTGVYEDATLPIVRSSSCACGNPLNPSPGPLIAVAWPSAQFTYTLDTDFNATCSITPITSGSDLIGFELDGDTGEQIDCVGGLQNMGLVTAFCSDIVGWAFTVVDFDISEFVPHIFSGTITEWSTGGAPPDLVAGDRVALGDFQTATPAVEAWLQANYEYYGNILGSGDQIPTLEMQIHSPSAPYPRTFHIEVENVYLLAKAATTDCTER